jgi:hypothetical protein
MSSFDLSQANAERLVSVARSAKFLAFLWLDTRSFARRSGCVHLYIAFM